MSFNQSNEQSRTRTEGLKSGPDNLDGLTLAAAFRKHVIEDDEIADIGRRILEISPSNSAVFLEGQFPSASCDFLWPLHVNAESIAWGFVGSPLVLLGRKLPTPSELETTASKLLADRKAALIGRLARGEIIAVAMFAATGVEGPIGAGQWTRTDLFIDVKNSAICEMRDHRPIAVWTGVCLRLPDQDPSEDQAVIPKEDIEQPTNARKQIQTKEKSRRECLDWLRSMMSDSGVMPLTNDELRAEAKSRWPKTLSKRAFDRCRARALDDLSEEQRYLWERPGPKRKRS